MNMVLTCCTAAVSHFLVCDFLFFYFFFCHAEFGSDVWQQAGAM